MIVQILVHLAVELRYIHSTPCVRKTSQIGEVYWVDAKAEGDTVVVGGWRSFEGVRTSNAPWFSLQLARKTAPWAFEKGEPFRTIASLELLASRIGLMVLVPKASDGGDSVGLVGLSVGTGNQGNTYLLTRMLTTKYPLGVVLMELAHQCRVGQFVLCAHWLPRRENEEADALANFDFRHFPADSRMEVGLDTLEFGVLPFLLDKGQDYLNELAQAQARAKARMLRALERKGDGGDGKRKKIADTLAQRDPW